MGFNIYYSFSKSLFRLDNSSKSPNVDFFFSFSIFLIVLVVEVVPFFFTTLSVDLKTLVWETKIFLFSFENSSIWKSNTSPIIKLDPINSAKCDPIRYWQT